MRNTILAAVSAATLATGGLAALPANAAPIANSLANVEAGLPVDNVAYVLGGRQYCFYPDGWHGPGWYWCGYRWHRGYGWGGVVGWNSWDVGPRYRERFGFGHGRGFDHGPRMGRDFDHGGRDFDRGGRRGHFSEDRSTGRQPGMNMNEGRSSSMGGRGPGMGPSGGAGGAGGMSHGAGGGGGGMGGGAAGHAGSPGGAAGGAGGPGGGGGGGDRH